MTIVAGIRRSKRHRQIGTRDAEAVIVAPIDDHVGASRHVARRAAKRRVSTRMVMMRHGRVLVRRVTLQAHTITGSTKLCAVRLMTIAAGDSCREHLALLEWGIIVRLFNVADLS